MMQEGRGKAVVRFKVASENGKMPKQYAISRLTKPAVRRQTCGMAGGKQRSGRQSVNSNCRRSAARERDMRTADACEVCSVRWPPATRLNCEVGGALAASRRASVDPKGD
jgi:hypothetical protein